MRGTNGLIALLMAAPSLAQAPAQPAEPTLKELISPHSYAIRLEQGRLVGPGAELLLDTAGRTQFVGIGEEHNHRDIPAITAALFGALHSSHGFNYLADEQDPVMMRTVSEAPVRGSRTRVEALAKRYKLGFTFISDQELAMLAKIGRLSSGRGRPIWGCEQAFGVTHVLDRLAPRAKGAATRALIQDLRNQSVKEEAIRDLAKGHFMAREDIGPKLRQLSEAFAKSEEDTRFVADAPRQSNLIYSYYHNSTRGEVPGGYSNSRVREEYMKSVCLAEYRHAERRDGRPPKLVFKFGHWHVYDGWNPNNVTSLGNFFSNFARVNGTGYTSVATFAATYKGEPVWDIKRLSYLSAFKDIARPTEWRLIDLRPLREGRVLQQMRAAIAPLDPAMRTELNRLLYGFDFALFLGAYAPASFDVAKVPY